MMSQGDEVLIVASVTIHTGVEIERLQFSLVRLGQ